MDPVADAEGDDAFEAFLQQSSNGTGGQLTIKVTADNKLGVSNVWKYFGQLHRDGAIIDKKNTYCKLCFDTRIIKRYSQKTSTGNLSTHLSDVHNIDIKKLNTEVKQKKIDSYFTGLSHQTVQVTPDRDKHFRLAREIAMWFSRDLLPFATVSTDAFSDFCHKYGIVKHQETLPTDRTIAITALDDIYQWTRKTVIEKLNAAPSVLGLTFDCWTDNYKRLTYITYTTHWISNTWISKSVTLRTSFFPHPHTGELISKDVQDVLEEFGLKDRKILVTSDCGANIIKACRLAGLDRLACVAHGIHNLITRDLLGNPEMQRLKALLVKMREVHRALIYRHHEIEETWRTSNQAKLLSLIEHHEEIEKILEADDKIGANYDSDHNVDALLQSGIPTIKKDMPTRWMSCYSMVESFTKNQEIITQMLEKMKLYDKILDDEEGILAEQFLDILKIFKDATDILQGQKYATINLALLFLSEIRQNLDTASQSFGDIGTAARILIENLKKRFPVYPEYVGAAVLDPKLKNLTLVNEYLLEVNQTKIVLLRALAVKFNVDLDNSEKMPNTPEPTPSKSTPDLKRKKLINEIVLKHIHTEKVDTFQDEVDKYSLISTNFEDGLDATNWWKINANAFPLLADLASKLLSIPVTSAASERVFSVAGGIITAKRSSINPSKVKKLVFIHDNYDLAIQKL